MNCVAFQARHEHRRIGQLPWGNVCSATEYVSEGLTLFFRNRDYSDHRVKEANR